MELGELLEFPGRCLSDGGDHLADSFSRFVGSDAEDTDGLRADLWRFAFLLGVRNRRNLQRIGERGLKAPD